MSLLKYGAHPNFVKWYLHVWDNIYHQLITAFGLDSMQFPPPKVQVEGAGQG